MERSSHRDRRHPSSHSRQPAHRVRRCLHARSAGRHRGPGGLQPRAEDPHGQAESPAGAAVSPRGEPIAFLDPESDHRADPHHGRRCARRQLRRLRDPARPPSASGSRAPAPAPNPTRRWSRAFATSPMPCFRAPTVGCSTARTPSARSPPCRSTTSATSSWPSPTTRVFLEVAEKVAGTDERLGRGLLRPADHRRLASAARLHHHPLPRPRAPPGRPSHPRRRRHRHVGLHRRHGALRRQQLPQPAGQGRLGRALPAQDPDRRRGGAVERDAHRPRTPPGSRRSAPSRSTSWSSSSRPPSSSWRSGRRSAPTSSATTPAAGTTSTRSPTPTPGIRTSSTPTSSPSS